ncbi:MAG: hypothetical protein Q9210_003299 [Variospora velana]
MASDASKLVKLTVKDQGRSRRTSHEREDAVRRQDVSDLRQVLNTRFDRLDERTDMLGTSLERLSIESASPPRSCHEPDDTITTMFDNLWHPFFNLNERLLSGQGLQAQRLTDLTQLLEGDAQHRSCEMKLEDLRKGLIGEEQALTKIQENLLSLHTSVATENIKHAKVNSLLHDLEAERKHRHERDGDVAEVKQHVRMLLEKQATESMERLQHLQHLQLVLERQPSERPEIADVKQHLQLVLEKQSSERSEMAEVKQHLQLVLEKQSSERSEMAEVKQHLQLVLGRQSSERSEIAEVRQHLQLVLERQSSERSEMAEVRQHLQLVLEKQSAERSDNLAAQTEQLKEHWVEQMKQLEGFCATEKALLEKGWAAERQALHVTNQCQAGEINRQTRAFYAVFGGDRGLCLKCASSWEGNEHLVASHQTLLASKGRSQHGVQQYGFPGSLSPLIVPASDSDMATPPEDGGDLLNDFDALLEVAPT